MTGNGERFQARLWCMKTKNGISGDGAGVSQCDDFMQCLHYSIGVNNYIVRPYRDW